MKSIQFVTALAVLALSGGCSGLQWTKAGADANATARDQDECRARALGHATSPVAAPGSTDMRTDGNRPPVMAPASGSNERFIAEHEVVRRCMLQRGYELR